MATNFMPKTTKTTTFWETSGRHLGGIWEASGRPGLPRRSQGDLSGLSLKKLSTSHAKCSFRKKHQFYGVFLKVTSPLMVNLQQLRGGTVRAGFVGPPPAHYQDRQNPYSSGAVWGNILETVVCFVVLSFSGPSVQLMS